MSYFDSRVDEGPVLQVVSIRVVEVEVSVDMKVNITGVKMGEFGAKG